MRRLTKSFLPSGLTVHTTFGRCIRHLGCLRGDYRPGGDAGYSATEKREDQEARELQQHGNCSGPPLPRDEAIRYIRQHGRKKWKRIHGYHRRSLAETAVYRFKGLMGRFVEARTWENEWTEVRLKAKTLNRMTRLGMPETNKVAV